MRWYVKKKETCYKRQPQNFCKIHEEYSVGEFLQKRIKFVCEIFKRWWLTRDAGKRLGWFPFLKKTERISITRFWVIKTYKFLKDEKSVSFTSGSCSYISTQVCPLWAQWLYRLPPKYLNVTREPGFLEYHQNNNMVTTRRIRFWNCHIKSSANN